MRFTLELTLLRKERALERVLGLVGRRGYEVVEVSARLEDDGSVMAVRLRVESDRSHDVLVRHLRKLREVAEVRGLSGLRQTG